MHTLDKSPPSPHSARTKARLLIYASYPTYVPILAFRDKDPPFRILSNPTHFPPSVALPTRAFVKMPQGQAHNFRACPEFPIWALEEEFRLDEGQSL
jgi:hypothetical protein